MNRRNLIQLGTLVVSLISLVPSASAAISKNDARAAIARMAGMSLPKSAVHTGSIVSSSDSTAEVAADLDLAFRFAEESGGLWRIKELRTGEGEWQPIEFFVRSTGLQLSPETCDNKDNFQRTTLPLSVRRARCLLADLFGVQMPSDTLRIRSVSTGLGLRRSALIESVVGASFRLKKDARGWRVSELKTGNRDWLNLEGVPSSIDALKRTRATDELNQIATALDAYRQARGNFVVTDKHHVLIDNLNPEFLHQVLRLDPWGHPYRYSGERDRFTLRSVGPDGKENTADDLTLSR
jgi:hypothetical protein